MSRGDTVRSTLIRLFLTCWLVYALHFSTNIVREVYLGLAIGDHLSFRVDEYAHLHADLFETAGRGWHINNNPGASMLAALPYAAAAPVIREVTARVNSRRAASGEHPPRFGSPWPLAQEFYEKSWHLGLDIKFGLAAMVMQVFLMAPLSAFAALLMFKLLYRRGLSERCALLLSLLYAFGTPVFFRTGYLNQNLLVAHAALVGLWALDTPSFRRGAVIAGLAAGGAVLMDYSGIMILLCLAVWMLATRAGQFVRFACAAAIPIAILWFYQWACFGDPFTPAQRYMTPTRLSGAGFSGITLPQLELAWANLFDYRFGLFTSCPLLLLALGLPFVSRRGMVCKEVYFLLGSAFSFLVFVSMVQYSRLQFNTGVRYLVAVVPFLFLALVPVLCRLPRPLVNTFAALAVGQAWSTAMYREVEMGKGLLEPILHVATGGVSLPALTTAARGGYSMPPAWLFIAVAAVILLAIWWRAFPKQPVSLRNY